MQTRSLDRLRRRLLGAATAVAAAALSGFGLPAAAQETPVRGGVLRYATLGLDTADAHRHTGSIGVVQAYAEALTSIGPDGGVEPFLAESFGVSPDGRTYTFTLRDGVRFHDGAVLTAADVAANFLRVQQNVTGGWLASAMKLVDGFEAVDARTFVVRMSEPYAPFLNLLSELWILSPNSPGWDDQISQPIGTGPFRFGEWAPGVRLLAPAHDAYWREGRPFVEAVEFNLREDLDKALALRSGDLDIASIGRDALPEIEADPNIEVKSLKDTSWYFVSFNNRSPRPPFDDVRVREAIMHAVDKRAFMRFVAGEDGIVTNQMVIPGNVYHDDALAAADELIDADLDRARALLAEAGVDPAETTVQVVSWQNAYSQVVVQMIRELGFEVEHTALDDLGAQQRLGQYDWDVAPMSSGPRADIFMRYVRMMSDGPNPVLWGGVQDAEYDRLVKAAVQEPDLQKRRAHYLDAWKLAMDNYYTVVLGHSQSLVANRASVRGWEPGYTWSPNWASGGLAEVWLAPGQ